MTRSNSSNLVSLSGERQNKRVLVTGGAGFIGSHLIERLLDTGHSVTCLDNLRTGTLRNVEHFRANSNFQFVKADVIEPYFHEVDRIYNLACPASPPKYQRDPLHTFKTSILGAMNLVEAARKSGARVLQASTSEVYGEPHVHPQPERYWGNVNPVGIRSCYDEGKRGAETYLTDASRQLGVEARIVRIFNTYGPRMAADDGRVVSNFIVQALTNKDITICGDGSQTRSFCYVDDLVDGLLALMESKAGVEPVNLGNPVEFTIRELADLVIKMTGSRSRIIRLPLPADDPTQRKPDISRAQDVLSWRPKVKLEQGLERTIAYFEQELSARPARQGRH